MDSLKHRIARSIAQRGVIGTIPMCWWSMVSLFRPAARRLKASRLQSDAAFDLEHGVETSGNVRPRPEAVLGNNWRHGVQYQAVNAGEFDHILNSIPLEHSQFTFMDFGSGKGRALLLAARLPFGRIVGIEYCEELNEIARRNVFRHPVSGRHPQRIEIITADATTFPIPDEPLVLFFFNPFGEQVMTQVAHNVMEASKRRPRRIVIIYFTPYHATVWERTGVFTRIQDSPAVFDTSPP